MTARTEVPFEPGRAVSDIEALLAEPVPKGGRTESKGDQGTGDRARTTGDGFVLAPLWGSRPFTGVFAPEWTEAEEAAAGHLSSLVRELDRRYGPHRQVGMRVPLFRKIAGDPMPPLFQALCDEDLLGDLTVWGPLPIGPGGASRWLAVSLNQSDGDAPVIMIAAVTDGAVSELED